MKATTYAEYFEFNLSRVPISNIPEDERDEFENVENVYAAVDGQGTFQTRYFDDIKLLPDQFDSLFDDYIRDNIEEDGFVFNPDGDDYCIQALAWCDQNAEYKGSFLRNIIACMVDPSLIEDDTELDVA